MYFTPSGSSAMVSLYTRATQAIMLSLVTTRPCRSLSVPDFLLTLSLSRPHCVVD